jgi:hypothetical protein
MFTNVSQWKNATNNPVIYLMISYYAFNDSQCLPVTFRYTLNDHPLRQKKKMRPMTDSQTTP